MANKIKGGVDQRADNEDCCERLRERGWIPGKADCGCKNAGNREPKYGLLPSPEPVGGSIVTSHCVCPVVSEQS
jgi:hypothetical protein